MSESIRDQWAERCDKAPDKWTLEWWRKELGEIKAGYRGASHAVNLCVDQYQTVMDHVLELERRRELLQNEIEDCGAELGKLRADFVQLAERVETMARWLKAQHNGKQNASETVGGPGG